MDTTELLMNLLCDGDALRATECVVTDGHGPDWAQVGEPCSDVLCDAWEPVRTRYSYDLTDHATLFRQLSGSVWHGEDSVSGYLLEITEFELYAADGVCDVRIVAGGPMHGAWIQRVIGSDWTNDSDSAVDTYLRKLDGKAWHNDDDHHAREVEYPYSSDSRVYSTLVSRDAARAHGLREALHHAAFNLRAQRCEHEYDCCGNWYDKQLTIHRRTKFWLEVSQWSYLNV